MIIDGKSISFTQSMLGLNHQTGDRRLWMSCTLRHIAQRSALSKHCKCLQPNAVDFSDLRDVYIQLERQLRAEVEVCDPQFAAGEQLEVEEICGGTKEQRLRRAEKATARWRAQYASLALDRGVRLAAWAVLNKQCEREARLREAKKNLSRVAVTKRDTDASMVATANSGESYREKAPRVSEASGSEGSRKCWAWLEAEVPSDPWV